MYLLTYYDDLKTLLPPIEPPYLQADMAKDAMKRAILEYLKEHGAEPDDFYASAKEQEKFYFDVESEIELSLSSFYAYLRTQNQEPFFATFQILNLNEVTPYFHTPSGIEKRNMQMEALLEVLEPLLSIFASTDVVFSPKAGYTVLCVTPYTSEVLESKSINEPKEMAAYLLDSIKYDYCFSLGVNTLLSTDSFCSLEELEYAMPHYQKAVYSAVFKEVQDKISSILAQPPLRTPRFSLQEDPLLTVLYNFQRSLSLQQRLFSVPDKKIYQNYRKALLEAYCQKYGAVYLGKFPADGIGKMTYTKYKKTDEYDEYDFCIPYPDTDLLNLVNQWDTTNSAKKIPLYYKIQERVLSQKGLWINWEKQSLRILKK